MMFWDRVCFSQDQFIGTQAGNLTRAYMSITTVIFLVGVYVGLLVVFVWFSFLLLFRHRYGLI